MAEKKENIDLEEKDIRLVLIVNMTPRSGGSRGKLE